MLTKINHIGIAVKSLEETLPFYRDSLGMAFAGIEEVAEQKVRVAMLPGRRIQDRTAGTDL